MPGPTKLVEPSTLESLRVEAGVSLTGRTLEGRFRVERRIAEGGFGVVYRAQQLVLDRPVALKVLKTPPGLDGPSARAFEAQFQDEARTIARLRHPHIVEVFDFGVSPGAGGAVVCWMALEWLEGRTLEAEIEEQRQRRSSVSPGRALELMRPVIQAVTHAHGAQVVHRDLKPANVFLVESPGRVIPKVLDFGIAQLVGGEAVVTVAGGGGFVGKGKTTSGLAQFSPDYAAPEQVSYGRTGPWTDVHALGLVLTEILTGRPAYEGGDPQDRLGAILLRQRPTPASKGVDVGQWESVLAKALALRPADRYPDAAALLTALEGGVADRREPFTGSPTDEVKIAAKRETPRRFKQAAGSLPAKLSRPQPTDAIARPRLFRDLDRLTRKPLTWIHAPAGAGKTTLVSSYLAARQAPVLWYDMDSGDGDVSNLYHYVRMAAEALLGKRAALPVPRPGSPDAQRIFARRFFEALFAQLPAGTVLVFDNYQEAAGSGSWNDTFRELCAAMTAGVRIVVASRVTPPPSLARLGASGQLQLLEWSRLRLDLTEVRRFLRREGRSTASLVKDSGKLLAMTDGWAVAVTLLARSHGPGEKSAPGSGRRELPRNPTAHIDAVFPFLAGEILERLDGPTRQFLLQIALFPTFTAQMAADLSGRPDTVSLLSRLYGEHLLIEWRGENDFRLHDLFRMFLLERGRQVHGDEAWDVLSVRAALLLDGPEHFQPASELLAATRSWKLLAELIERQAPVLAAQGRLSAVGAALDRLPAPERDARPWLLFWHGASSLGRPGGQAQALAESAFQQFRASGDQPGTLLSWALVVQAIVIAGDSFRQLEGWLRTLDELRSGPLPPPIASRVALSEVLAYAFWEVGTPRSMEVADRALEVVRQHGSSEDRILVGGAALLLYIHGGQRDRAEEMSRLARSEFKAAGSDPLPRLAYLHSEAILLFNGARFLASLRAVEQGLALARASGIEVWNGSLLMLGVLNARARGDLATAEKYLEAMSPVAANGPAFARSQLAFGRACLAFERGDFDVALRGIRDSIHTGDLVGFKFASTQTAMAEVFCQVARGDDAGVAEALGRVETRMAEAACPYLEAEAELARLYARCSAGEDIRGPLRAVMGWQRQNDIYSGAFLGPRVMSRLLTVALEHDIEPEYTRKVLRAHGLPVRLPRPKAASRTARSR